MKKYIYGQNTVLVEDDTTIYEIDMNCFRSLPAEKRAEYFPEAVRTALDERKKGR